MHHVHCISHVLLDIEGTTCPVSFVATVLFPYASDHLLSYLSDNQLNPVVQGLIEELEALWADDQDPTALRLLEERERSSCSQIESLTGYLQHLIQCDRKATPLKELQGMIWASGYAQAELVGPLFEDVPAALTQWREMGLSLCVYSSGSVAAQQLIYQYSNAGDLSGLFDGWFDTRIGPKQSPESYRKIQESLGCEASRILFISDSVDELDAARAAGLQVAMSQRDGEAASIGADAAVIRSFADLCLHQD